MKIIETKHGAALGLSMKFGNSPLLVITAPRGYLACGYINPATAEKIGDCCGIVTGVKTYDDMLTAKLIFASKAAQKLGVKEGMKGIDALDKLV